MKTSSDDVRGTRGPTPEATVSETRERSETTQDGEARTPLSNRLRTLGDVLNAALPEHVGFVLVLHSYGSADTTRAAVGYSSDTTRADASRILEACAAQLALPTPEPR
jgi:hypothetical protein